jgi:multiple sugar transport system permease protein
MSQTLSTTPGVPVNNDRNNRNYRRAKLAKAAANKFIVYLVLVFGAVLMLLPLLWMVTTSLSNNEYATSFPPHFIPTHFEFGKYVSIFTNHDMGQFFLNSIIIVVPSIAGQIISSSMAAFAFARLRAPGKRILFIMTIATLMIPYEVTIIPTFILFRYFHWINTFWPLIVPQLFGNAYNIFLMRQFMMSIPTELDDAAKIDGLGFFGIWRRIILPLSFAPIATVGVFTFTFNWGSFLAPLIYISKTRFYPLALGIYMMTQTSNRGQIPPWNLIMAGSMLLTVPMVLVYFFSQRYLYEGSNVLGKIT